MKVLKYIYDNTIGWFINGFDWRYALACILSIPVIFMFWVAVLSLLALLSALVVSMIYLHPLFFILALASIVDVLLIKLFWTLSDDLVSGKIKINLKWKGFKKWKN